MCDDVGGLNSHTDTRFGTSAADFRSPIVLSRFRMIRGLLLSGLAKENLKFAFTDNACLPDLLARWTQRCVKVSSDSSYRQRPLIELPRNSARLAVTAASDVKAEETGHCFSLSIVPLVTAWQRIAKDR